ncbi:conserved hypothetical protein [Theileria orientalis strain Shintoku]|uniref:Uncharacterized protein n=1 Tax=Theileria orientalis strain Shintoku TaxID=869250 RepID=J4C8X2_THEOR|nr:conserved hypothetical protein [Theileria orientalis strain Shintoku]PVC53021.1 hypothetical protein MACL_00000397 [Theileria orientalis]BAM41533.1 conserved hypothetical protein [Theileria orientalis strain Shintoku]|eukprot:XP_009691834.1 conserved hypothetical protein [Theileria orientalis strain Shintoku]
MPSEKEINKVIKDNLSHPPDVIKYHITTGYLLQMTLFFILKCLWETSEFGCHYKFIRKEKYN